MLGLVKIYFSFYMLELRVKTHYSDPFWDVTLYYFLGVCMFECIALQSFERIS